MPSWVLLLMQARRTLPKRSGRKRACYILTSSQSELLKMPSSGQSKPSRLLREPTKYLATRTKGAPMTSRSKVVASRLMARERKKIGHLHQTSGMIRTPHTTLGGPGRGQNARPARPLKRKMQRRLVKVMLIMLTSVRTGLVASRKARARRNNLHGLDGPQRLCPLRRRRVARRTRMMPRVMPQASLASTGATSTLARSWMT
mmetsp:Transcript_29053/g.52926  ORF Transcript_29053/g.52926 Transcript_29053/m.52926 type:complete len:202 (+) Transcript_29053:80-685(+)